MRILSKNGFWALLGAGCGALVTALAWRVDARGRSHEGARLHRALVELLLNALSAGDPVTERHSRRVADLADVVFRDLSFNRSEHSTLRLAALLHDMGKIDDRFFHILHSYTALSDEERQRMKEHPNESADILEPLEQIHPGISRIVEAHHECWNGKGYPNGLRNEAIPIGARIISVADVFDAMTQPRAYREPLHVEEAMAELRKGSGTRFDPAVVDRVQEPTIREQWAEIVRRGREEEAEQVEGSEETGDPGSPKMESTE